MNAFIAHMLENSMILSFAIILLAAAGRFLHEKTSPGLRYALWLLIVAGLLLPYRPAPLTVSIPENAPAAEFTAALGQINYYGEQARQWLNETLADGADAKERNADDNAAEIMSRFPRLTARIPAETPETPAAETPLINKEKLFQLLRRYAPFTVWALGAVVFIFICALRHTRFVKTIKQNSTPVNDGRLAELVNETRNILRLKRRVRVIACTVITTPLLLGVFKPVIVMPAQEIDEEKTRLMLLHEMLHIKRLDMCVKLFALAAAAAHWFNPLAYLMCRTLAEESERACDRAVIKHAGFDNRYAYCETLFSAARGRGQAAVMSFGLTGGGRRLKKRAETILETVKPKKRLVISLTALLLAGVILSGGLFACSGKAADGPNRFGIDAESIAAASALGEKGVLNVGLSYDDDMFRRAVEIFEYTFEGWKVETIPLDGAGNPAGGAYAETLALSVENLLREGAVDIVNVLFTEEWARLRDIGLLADLLTLAPHDAGEVFGRLLPCARDVMTADGRLCFAPLWFTMPCVQNSPMFYTYMLEFPEDWESWTWDGLAGFFEGYIEGSMKGNWPGLETLLMVTPREFVGELLFYNGAYLLGPDGEVDFKSPVFKEILLTAEDFYRRGLLAESVGGDMDAELRKYMLYFTMQERAADYRNYRINGAQCYPMPRLSGVPGKAMHSVNAFGVREGIPPERGVAAWEFIKILLSDEVQNGVKGWRLPVINELSMEGVLNHSGGGPSVNNIITYNITEDDVARYNLDRQAFYSDVNRLAGAPAGLADIVYAQALRFCEGLVSLDECIENIEREWK